MKKLSLAIAVLLGLGLSNQSHADISPTDMIAKFMDAAQSGSGSVLTKICSKGSLLSGNFTIRSGNGEACRIPEVGFLAEVLCPTAAADYMGSQCHTKAEQTLSKADGRNSLLNKIPQKGFLCTLAKGKVKNSGEAAQEYFNSVCGK